MRARSQSRLSNGRQRRRARAGRQVGRGARDPRRGEPLAAQAADGDRLQLAGRRRARRASRAAARSGGAGSARARGRRARRRASARRAARPRARPRRRSGRRRGGGEHAGRQAALEDVPHAARSPPIRPATPIRPVIHSSVSRRAIVWRPETSSVHQPWRHGSAERSSSSRARSGPRARSSATSSSANAALAARNARARSARVVGAAQPRAHRPAMQRQVGGGDERRLVRPGVEQRPVAVGGLLERRVAQRAEPREEHEQRAARDRADGVELQAADLLGHGGDRGGPAPAARGAARRPAPGRAGPAGAPARSRCGAGSDALARQELVRERALAHVGVRDELVVGHPRRVALPRLRDPGSRTACPCRSGKKTGSVALTCARCRLALRSGLAFTSASTPTSGSLRSAVVPAGERAHEAPQQRPARAHVGLAGDDHELVVRRHADVVHLQDHRLAGRAAAARRPRRSRTSRARRRRAWSAARARG